MTSCCLPYAPISKHGAFLSYDYYRKLIKETPCWKLSQTAVHQNCIIFVENQASFWLMSVDD